MKHQILIILTVISLLTACALSPQPKETPEASVPAAETQTIAYAVPFEELKDGDRFIVVNKAKMRTLTSISEMDSFVASSVRKGAEGLTHIPEHSLIFTFEKGEGNHFRMKTEEGFLTSAEMGYALYLKTQVSPCSEWEAMTDGTILCTGAVWEEEGQESGMYLYLYDYENDFVTRERQENDPEPFEMVFYRIDDGYTPRMDDGKGYRLPVFETSDLHGYIASSENGVRFYDLARFAEMIKEARNRSGSERCDTVVLLDGGDMFQGSTLSNLLEGKPILTALHAMQYDAVTVGNHEFDWGIETVIDPDATLANSGIQNEMDNQIPVILSNLYRNGEKPSFTKDYVVLEKTALDAEGNELPVRIGILGFTGDYSDTIRDSLFKDLGYEIREDYDAMRELVKTLREKEHCDAVIILSHTDANLILPNLKPEKEADLMLGGHKHISDFGISENGTAYVMPAGNGMAMSYAELVFRKDESGNAVLETVPEPYIIANDEAEGLLPEETAGMEFLEPTIKNISDEAIDQLQSILEEEVGRISVSILIDEYLPGSGNRSCTGGNWYSSLYARAADADIGFINHYGMRKTFVLSPEESEQVITTADVLAMLPFSNHIWCFELSYEELLTAFQYALTPDGQNLFGMMSGIDCYFEGDTVNALVRDGETIYAHGKWYNGHGQDRVRVAVSDFMASSNRNEYGMDNPFIAWSSTSRLITDDLNEADEVLKVLKKEAAENEGRLYVDTEPHFIEGDYMPPEDGR